VTSTKEQKGGPRRYNVELSKPDVVLVFNNALCTESNWSEWAKRFAPSATDPPTETVLKPIPVTSDDRKEVAESNVKRFRLDITGGAKLSLRSELLGGARLIDDVLIADLEDLGHDILSPRSAAFLVERLAAKAIRSAPKFKVSSGKIRDGVRAHAKHVLKTESRGLRALGRLKIRKLKTQLDAVDKYIAGVPELERIGELAKGSQVVLGQLDSLLRMIETPKDSDDSKDADDMVVHSPQAAVDSLLASPVRNSADSLPPALPNPPSSDDNGYRELDEEWQPRKGR
jgi:hypothetical protein